MYKLVYTSNPSMTHHLNEKVDIYIGEFLTTVNKEGKGFATSEVVSSAAIADAGVIIKTSNSVYIFAYVDDSIVCPKVHEYNSERYYKF